VDRAEDVVPEKKAKAVLTTLSHNIISRPFREISLGPSNTVASSTRPAVPIPIVNVVSFNDPKESTL
jgi:hypothetical protein